MKSKHARKTEPAAVAGLGVVTTTSKGTNCRPRFRSFDGKPPELLGVRPASKSLSGAETWHAVAADCQNEPFEFYQMRRDPDVVSEVEAFAREEKHTLEVRSSVTGTTVIDYFAAGVAALGLALLWGFVGAFRSLR